MRAEKIEALAKDITDEVFGKWESCQMVADFNKWSETAEKVKQIIRKHCNKKR